MEVRGYAFKERMRRLQIQSIRATGPLFLSNLLNNDLRYRTIDCVSYQRLHWCYRASSDCVLPEPSPVNIRKKELRGEQGDDTAYCELKTLE